ncbi:uncharacterized protein LOC122008424 [Zingiber officinale]|uniref:uncharacterized protein LOC122008424 n=1 Tax=Zingiber officinale TaxID=94328 RepID=UPI001C4CFD5C|nr:uncharacterized protein LOC122008424 [Zingiber officinale]
MGEQNPTPPAAPKSLDPEREERTNATAKTNCDEKFLPRYLMPLQGSRHDLCKTQRKMDTVSSLTFLTSNENILSRYLVPSQGSCHDTCKYGHKHEGEEASRKHSFSRAFGNNQNEEHDQLNFVSVKHRQKTDFTSVPNQKLEIKSKTGQTKEQISDKFKLNEEIDLPPDKIILTFNPTLNLAGLELSSPINEQKTIASLDNSAAAKVDESIENGIDQHELVNTETVLVHTPVAVELERTAIQSEFSFHNDALIAEVGELPNKLFGLKSKVSSTVKGNTEFEHERANPSEIFSVETTPIADDIVPGECQTPNGEKESYNKLIGSKETVHRSSKEPLSLKSKNYKSKQSAKQIPAREELASKQALGIKLKTPLELERTAIQNEFSFHNDAVITEVGKSTKKHIDLKSMVSSTAEGKTDSEYERANPSEVFSVEHTSMELIPPTPFTDDIAPGECQTSNGEEESYNKPIDNMMESVHRSSKEPSSLKSKNYRSKESAKQRSSREELTSKRALGTKLKTPLELERTAIQNEFSFHNDAVITEVGKSTKKHIDLKSMVSSTAEGKTDSEYERANPSEVFSVEHTSMELIPPTPFTDDIAPGECQTSNGEEESYNKPIDNMMENVHRSSKEPSSLKSKNYKSKESAKQISSREELTSKRALGTKLKTPLKLERTAIQNEFSFHNDAVIAEVGKSAKKLIDLKSMVSSTAKGKTDTEYERANPSEVFSVEHTSMELIHPTPFTDDIVPGECQTSNGEEESYNKPIHSMIGTLDRSSKDTSSLRFKSYKSKESVKQRPIREELESKQALGMKLKTPLELERTAIQNEFSFHNDATIAEVDESPKKLFDFMVSSTVEGNTDSACERGNPSEAFSVEHTSMELIPPTPITDDIVPGECLTSIGEEESYSKLINSKMETVHQSSKGPSNLKFKECTSKESAKQRPSEELASKRALGVRLKAPLIQKTHAFNISMPQASFSLKHIHLKSLSIHDKKKRELNKPKIRIKEVGDIRKHKVVELQRYASNGPNIVKVNSALKKAIKVVRSESDHDNPTIACDAVAFVAPKVIIDSISPPSKSNNKATKAVACFRKKKVLETFSPPSNPSIYSKGVPGQRNQEKEKIIKVADNLQNIVNEVIEPLPTPSSSKPRFTRVPSFKLRKNMTIAPSFTMNNQAKARKTFVKGKNTRANEPNLEKIDLKALRQKLRKLGSFSDRKKEHATSGSQRSGGNEPFWLNEVSQARRTFGDVHKVERRSRSRRVSFDSEDKVGSSLKLIFSRSKIANLQPNSSSPPAWLTFGRAKTVGDYQNAKLSPTKSFRSWMKSDVGGTSTSPSKSIKVILRHKHADDKKVEKNLLNHVIEETASKLVESRKSKVKALVGAFETVISLQ